MVINKPHCVIYTVYVILLAVILQNIRQSLVHVLACKVVPVVDLLLNEVLFVMHIAHSSPVSNQKYHNGIRKNRVKLVC